MEHIYTKQFFIAHLICKVKFSCIFFCLPPKSGNPTSQYILLIFCSLYSMKTGTVCGFGLLFQYLPNMCTNRKHLIYIDWICDLYDVQILWKFIPTCLYTFAPCYYYIFVIHRRHFYSDVFISNLWTLLHVCLLENPTILHATNLRHKLLLKSQMRPICFMKIFLIYKIVYSAIILKQWNSQNSQKKIVSLLKKNYCKCLS